MLPPLCAWILANHRPCAQFARRGRRFCRAHEKLARIEQTNTERRALIDRIYDSTLIDLIPRIQDTLEAVIHHTISPDRAQFIFQVSLQRIEELQFQAESAAHNAGLPPRAPVEPSPRTAPSALPDRPLTMADILGPLGADMPIPRGVDLNDFASMMNDLNRLYPAEFFRRSPKTPSSPAPSATSGLNLVE